MLFILRHFASKFQWTGDNLACKHKLLTSFAFYSIIANTGRHSSFPFTSYFNENYCWHQGIFNAQIYMQQKTPDISLFMHRAHSTYIKLFLVTSFLPKIPIIWSRLPNWDDKIYCDSISNQNLPSIC